MSSWALPSPGTVIAMVALLVALSGTAVALQGRNSVDKNDIKRNAVRAKQIKADAVGAAEIGAGAVGAAEIADGQVTNIETDLTQSAVTEAEEGLGAFEAAVGPTLAVDAQPGDLILWSMQTEFRRASPGGDCVVDVSVTTPQETSVVQVFSRPGNATYQRAFLSAVDPSDGTTNPGEAGARALAVQVAGTYEFAFRGYGVGATCPFRNRQLVATVLR
jgi:hypothetical protein